MDEQSDGPDDVKTFRVATSYEGNCPHRNGGLGPEGQEFEFTVPEDLGTGVRVFAWVWYNREQEFNMNCAAVNITAPELGGGYESEVEGAQVSTTSNLVQSELSTVQVDGTITIWTTMTTKVTLTMETHVQAQSPPASSLAGGHGEVLSLSPNGTTTTRTTTTITSRIQSTTTISQAGESASEARCTNEKEVTHFRTENGCICTCPSTEDIELCVCYCYDPDDSPSSANTNASTNAARRLNPRYFFKEKVKHLLRTEHSPADTRRLNFRSTEHLHNPVAAMKVRDTTEDDEDCLLDLCVPDNSPSNLTARNPTSKHATFHVRPLMFIADDGNGCSTPKSTAELKYPDPGPNVVSGDGEYPVELPKGECRKPVRQAYHGQDGDDGH